MNKMGEKPIGLSSIEGCEIEIQAQKITSNNTPILIQTEDIVFPVKASRQANGIINKEYELKKPRFYSESNLDKGDKISGKILWGFSASPVRIINVGGSGRTSKHSGQNTLINGEFSFLTVVTSWSGNNLLIHPRDIFLASE